MCIRDRNQHQHQPQQEQTLMQQFADANQSSATTFSFNKFSSSINVEQMNDLNRSKNVQDSVPGLKYMETVSYTHLRAHETPEHLVCRLLLEKKNQ
eukprot:TRINITY_DN16786_c0_g1_i1.p1 TRINITY_DN16786_c0_g1~~TRINITY_DN16786_c0_g1_i1.p1  ORF type:complete len:109 (-),score=33.49 TRINITY_DN16786_c0_g1_i1:23-310(-)